MTPEGRLSLASPVRRSDHQVSTVLDGEAVILGLTSNEYFGLDAVGFRISELLEVPKTVQGIPDVLLEEYDVEPARGTDDLLALLQP